ncbi:MAG: aminopeptidase [Lachnospiraceae bacterium]
MDYRVLFRENNEAAAERFALASSRIRELAAGDVPEKMPEGLKQYVQRTAQFMEQVLETAAVLSEKEKQQDLSAYLKSCNTMLYADVVGSAYENSFANPAYAAEKLGTAMGQYLSFLYTEIRGMIRYAFEQRFMELTVCMEIFLEVFCILESAVSENESEEETLESVRSALYYYVSDYSDLFLDQRIAASLDPRYSFIRDIVMTADLSDTDYLYQYGDYITQDEIITSRYLAALPEETITLMADTYIDGYYKGFEISGIDLSRKEYVEVLYSFGFERVIRTAISRLESDGHQVICNRPAVALINKKLNHRRGCCGLSENDQFYYDHRYDIGLFMDSALKERKLSVLRSAYEHRKELAASMAGPAVLETFGEALFEPVNKPECTALTGRQQKLLAQMNTEMVRITYQFINAEERSFTIISFPTPAIGPHFEEIFNETIRLNTLDYGKYREIQQKIIDALDKCKYVVVKGIGNNRTDLTISLWDLQNPEKETIFENCLADMNIPLGEVFTSPRLTGTSGKLHVSEVYIDGIRFENLTFDLEDGMITDWSCTNFDDPEECRNLVQSMILFGHESLPMGEFAIGTNTVAYRMAKDYQIFDKLKILIAEKTGPHFAFGDTCYSNSEERKVFNPDGKEVIARENEVSAKRHTDAEHAYFGCHTDITLPYDELGSLCGYTAEGEEIRILLNGRYVLEGTEELNKALD